ncbi:MAG TPA: glutamine synthetase family protein [Clostridia bacterium]|nr:glutamine synthetase family protein [Clostridia bacterium]
MAATPSPVDARAALVARAKEDGISELWVIYHDVSGRPQVRSVPHQRLDRVLTGGVSFARANLDFNVLDHQVPDFALGAETGDFLAVPDPATYARVPHHPGAARTYSFLHDAGGQPWAGCARAALRAMDARYARRGLALRAAFEPECYLLAKTDEGYKPAARATMFSLNALESQRLLMSQVMTSLAEMGVELEQVAPEFGPGQYEINIAHQPPLRAADDLMTVKEELRALARAAGFIATFMPKPYATMPGSGLHVHLGAVSLDGSNAMEGDGPVGLSALGTSFVAGLLKHARGLSGLAAPTVNSYKRLLPGSWAPSHICYGGSNRAVLVRVPDSGSKHVEFRAGDSTGNPYLTLIGLLAAGLEGIEQHLPLGEPTEDDIGHLSEAGASARGLELLPRSAPEALDALEADAVLMDALGPVIGPGFLRIRRSEAAAYSLEIGEWERATYLEWS